MSISHCSKPPPGDAVVIELDEMWHFLQRKDNKVWIWKAYDRATGRLVDWECGDRDERTFRRLFERLARWKVRLFCSDSYGVYPLVLAVGNHYQGKGETVALERNNGQQRHWTAALRRRSIVVSKSLAMIERRVALFAHLHVNKEAAPEMYRLPIQAAGFHTCLKCSISPLNPLRMGPGYFPTILSILMIGLGAMIAVQALRAATRSTASARYPGAVSCS